MPDVITREERALIDAALDQWPAERVRVPAGRSGLPRIFWNGEHLAVEGTFKGHRALQAMRARGGMAAALAAQRRVAGRNAALCEDARAGLTYPELMDKYELSRGSICEIVTRGGGAVRPMPRDTSRAQALTARIVALADGVRQLPQIAQLAGCSARSVRDRRDALALDIPHGKAGRPRTYLEAAE